MNRSGAPDHDTIWRCIAAAHHFQYETLPKNALTRFAHINNVATGSRHASFDTIHDGHINSCNEREHYHKALESNKII